MLITPTLEARWFYPGKLPLDVSQWFYADCVGSDIDSHYPFAERDDQYFLTPGCELLSLKLREGNLELKCRQQELETVSTSARWSGKIEQWLKWSYVGFEQLYHLLLDQSKEKFWINVNKRRVQRVYQETAVELTQLILVDDIWWSIAFETVERAANQCDSFKAEISRVLGTYPGPPLLADCSYAYPAWLAKHINSSTLS